ncbi:TetR/AcrR family transcriptional regulator [Acrocarpospora catenulata]|uniref:TetR/AcrR family transcriptional regulator n=1 Tax=Acrocarpospora catenulata TaxID=2836182 RepID=UPI001BD9EA47|nr:TetR family transcriptional regulator [Acrocarpospora catenulata]
MGEVKTGRQQRQEKVAQTRARMIDAAYRLFTQRGYPATTMADIAAEAGVAVQTLYFTFRTKAELLQNVYERAVIGDADAPPEHQPWYAAMMAAPELDEALRILIDAVAAVLARTAPLDDYVKAASHDPEPARIRAHNEHLRRESWTQFIDHLSAKAPLQPGLTRQQATDILLMLMGPASYQTLVGEYGWTPQQWRDWCRQTASTMLFADHPA